MDIQKAVNFMLKTAINDKHGYDQAKRNSPDFDCSSLVATALNQAGFPVPTNAYTGNLADYLKQCYFVECQPPYKAGDIHLTPNKHCVMSVSEDCIVHASKNEKGTAKGGKSGDQTGTEICVRTYYEPSYGWKYHFRFISNC